jgi:hypothetical protein
MHRQLQCMHKTLQIGRLVPFYPYI